MISCLIHCPHCDEPVGWERNHRGAAYYTDPQTERRLPGTGCPECGRNLGDPDEAINMGVK